MKRLLAGLILIAVLAGCNLGAFYSEEFFKEKYHTSTTTTSTTTSTIAEENTKE